MKTEYQFKSDMEQFIDSNSFSKVVDLLLEIADEKRNHVLENWQDKNLAREYNRLSNKICTLQLTLERGKITL